MQHKYGPRLFPIVKSHTVQYLDTVMTIWQFPGGQSTVQMYSLNNLVQLNNNEEVHWLPAISLFESLDVPQIVV